ncbi:MAG: VTT domain-containing protein [Dehalococcoidales bacterium]|nr:VTT domain-containing protein [Dehalococcoidales bacterium]
MTTSQDKTPTPPKKSWLKRNALALVASSLVIGLTIGLFMFQGKIKQLGDYGYLGAFLISLLTNASILLPMPSLILIFPLGAAFNPVLVGLAAGAGGALGEMTAYIAGYSGRGIWHDNPNYIKAANWLKKWGMTIIFLYSATPMPLDLMGLAAGNLRFPAWKFFTACLPGKIIKYIALAYAGAWGWDLFINDAVFRTNISIGASVAVAVAVLFILALYLEHRDWYRRK